MDAMKLLLERTSRCKVQEPGPTQEELDTILRSALRAPDHGRLRPWHFIVITGEGRARFRQSPGRVAQGPRADSDAGNARARAAKSVARARGRCRRVANQVRRQNSRGVSKLFRLVLQREHIMLAAQAFAYGAMWRTGAPAYDERVKGRSSSAPGR